MKAKKLYIVSLCDRFLGNDYYEFHFRGYYQGIYITKIHLLSIDQLECTKEYLLKVSNVKIRDNILSAKVLTYRRIFN